MFLLDTKKKNVSVQTQCREGRKEKRRKIEDWIRFSRPWEIRPILIRPQKAGMRGWDD